MQAPAQDNAIVIIANKHIASLSQQQVYRLFSLRQKLLPNNIPVKLVVQPLSAPITQHFTHKVFDLYPYQLKRMWDRQVFSGKAESPKVIQSETELIEFIIGTPNALGYVSNSSELLSKYQGEINVITFY